MKRTLYLECNSGISGDMAAAALLDLGGSRDALEKALESLPLHGFRTEISRVKKGGIDCCDFNVILDEVHENHDHDMKYLYGHLEHDHVHSHADHHHHHEHDHVHEHEHTHEHTHDHDHQEHTHDHMHDHTHAHHEHRGLPEIRALIEAADLTEGARALALKIFTILAKAEAKAHGSTMEEVHFHEVGAVDSIVDILAIAVLFDSLGIDEVIVPSVAEGSGTVRCQHGILPVPVPAVLNIAEAEGLKLQIHPERKGELVTPTGAAFLAAVRTTEALPSSFTIRKTGLGAGKRAYEIPSILRAMLIEAEDGSEDECHIMKLESNLDDCTGEQLGYVMDRLFEGGARDVSFIPCYMKKNRPGYQLNVICMERDAAELEKIIFRDTTTIGIRRLKLMRSVLTREMITVETEYGPAQVKKVLLGDSCKVYPEYRDAAAIAKKSGLPYDEAVRMILSNCGEL